MREYNQFWTEDSINCIKEQRNFRYLEEKKSQHADELIKFTDKTTHRFSHGMDARRYGIMGVVEPEDKQEVIIFDSMKQMGVNMDLV